jgi:hypothetical protein
LNLLFVLLQSTLLFLPCIKYILFHPIAT